MSPGKSSDRATVHFRPARDDLKIRESQLKIRLNEGGCPWIRFRGDYPQGGGGLDRFLLLLFDGQYLKTRVAISLLMAEPPQPVTDWAKSTHDHQAASYKKSITRVLKACTN